MDRLETSVHRGQVAEDTQHFVPPGAQKQSRRINAREVIGVEAAEEFNPHLAAVEIQQHTVQQRLDDAAPEVGERLQRVGLDGRFRILHHHHSVAVVGVCQRESPGGQSVEKELLGPDIFGECLVVIEVVVRDVAEDSAHEGQPRRAVLHQRVRAHLHETVVAARFDHFGHHRVEPDAVGSGMRRRDLAVVHAVDHGRDQPGFIAQPAEHAVEQRRGSGFAVRPGHAHQLQPAARMPVKSRRDLPQRNGRIGHLYESHPGGPFGGQLLAHHGRRPGCDRGRNIGMAVGLRAPRSEKERTRHHLPRIKLEAADRDGPVTHERAHLDALQQFI